MDKRLLGVFLIFGKWPLKFWGVIWPKNSLVLGDLAKDSLVLIKPWHQGVIWPDHPNTKESFGQITPQNCTGYFLELTFCSKESFDRTTVENLYQITHITPFPLFHRRLHGYKFNGSEWF